MDRRGFLRQLLNGVAGAAAAHTLDLERLLWVPGAKTIVLPPVEGWVPHGTNQLLTLDWVTREALRVLENNLETMKRINREYEESFNVNAVHRHHDPARPYRLHGVDQKAHAVRARRVSSRT